MSISDALAFLLASTILAFTPGPDNIFVLVTSLGHGFRTAFRFILGLCTGVVLHTLLIVLGVSTLVSQSKYGLLILKYFAAFYLLWLAYKSYLHRKDTIQLTVDQNKHNFFIRGFIMNISNPKVLLFFLAFFPQFADLATVGYQIRLIMLGGLFIVVTLVAFSIIAWIGAKGSEKILNNPQYNLAINWLSICVFLAVAVLLLLS